jgi:hypothetical protein
MKIDEVDLVIFQMIKYLNFDKTKLIKLFSVISTNKAKIKKNVIIEISPPLRQSIWNWILNYPQEYIDLCKNNSTSLGTSYQIFEDFFEFSVTNKKKKVVLLPSLTMLLLLSPKIFSEVIMERKEGKKSESVRVRKFLDIILKELDDVSTICFVDLFKTSTYLSKSEFRNLRFLINEVQNSVQEKFLESLKTLNNLSDAKLMVDFLVSDYRINHVHVTSYIFPKYFLGSSLSRLVISKAILKLATEGAALSWHKTLSESYKIISKPIRLTFIDELTELSKQNELKKKTISTFDDKKKKPSSKPVQSNQEDKIYNTETILNLLTVFYCDPLIALSNTSDKISDHIADISSLFCYLCKCLNEIDNPQIQNQSYHVLLKLFDLKYIQQWCPEDKISAFIEVSSYVLINLFIFLSSDPDLGKIFFFFNFFFFNFFLIFFFFFLI